MNFSPSEYSRLKSRLKNRYLKDVPIILSGLKSFSQTKTAKWCHTHADELSHFSSFNWHFIAQLKLFLFLLKQDPSLGKKDFGDTEEIVFEKWNNSEFAREFLEFLNKGHHLGKASHLTLKLFDQHLETLADRHILKKNSLSKPYRLQTSLGEIKKKTGPGRLLETTLHLQGKDVRMMTSSLKEMKDFSHRIEVALKVIIKHSPSSWERFKAFTETIIPIKDPELVSYSHQDLPGYSMINLYHRDFVDLMDDLLHENGHHHLNYYLNLEKLIEEPLDHAYYSPWRRSLRPLRGVYHAYFTFFWAFKLFADLAKAKEMDSIFYLFSSQEKEKIYWRAVEEFLMLSLTFEELKWARKKKLIHDRGWNLIRAQHRELLKFKKHVPVWEKKIKAHKKELVELKATLKKSAREYSKN